MSTITTSLTATETTPITALRAGTGLARRAGITMKSAFVAMVAVAAIVSFAAPAQAGVNLEPTTPPGYSQPLALYMRNGHIYGAWAVGNKGNAYAGTHEVGIYINSQRVLVARINGLPSRYMTYGTDAPLDSLPNGTSTVELRVNDSRWIGEDTFADNIYSVQVTVNRGGGGSSGGGGQNPPAPQPLTRNQANYQWPTTLANTSVSRIISRMTEMMAVQWKPTADFTNWGYVDSNTGQNTYSDPYLKGTTYYGLPYSQAEQVSLAGFTGYLPAMSGRLNSATSAGVDCSGSIGEAWELPLAPNGGRHNTTTFDTANSSYFTSVVDTGKLVANASKIQVGDAIVSKSWGHMVLVESLPVNGKIGLLEATPGNGKDINGNTAHWAVLRTNTRSLSDLDTNKCRVIRRNKLQ